MNTRKDNKGRALAAWKNLPPGHIDKPLRHIERLAGDKSEQYRLAALAASVGDGLFVQNIARSMS